MKKQIMFTSLLLVFFFATSSISSTHVNGLIDETSIFDLSCSGSDLYFEDFSTEAYKDPSTTALGWGAGALTNTRDFSWELLDFYNTTFPVRSVDVQGRKVYVSQFNNTDPSHSIGVYDINDPSNILLMSERASIIRTLTFVVDGDAGYAGTDYDPQNFIPYNVSKPYGFDGIDVYLGGINRDGPVTDIDPEGYLVYYTVYNSASDSSLRVFNAADPDNPIDIPASWTSNKALGLEVEGHFAYVAASTDGLYILNVTNKNAFVEIGHVGLPGNATDVILDGRFAYVSLGDAGVALVDVSNPTLPVLRDIYDTVGISSQMVLQGNTLFVADGPGGVSVLDVASHEHFAFVTDMPLPYVWDVDLYGGILVVASDDGIRTFRICAGAGITDFSQSYYVNAFADFQAWDVRVLGDIAYVAGGSDGFYTLNVRDPSNPILLDRVTPPGSPSFRKLDVKGQFAHLISDFTYYIYDIQDPANIKEVGYIGGTQLLDVFVSGDLVYLSWQLGGYGVINVTHPNLLSWGNELDEPHFGVNITALWVQGPHVYLVDSVGGPGDGFYIYQALDLTNQQRTDVDTRSSYYYDIKVDGDIAYTSDSNWLVVFDVTNPYNILFLEDIQVDLVYVRSTGIWNFGPYLLNAGGSDGVSLINATDLYNCEATQYTGATSAIQISSYGDYTYVANIDSLIILRHFESAGDTYVPGTVLAQSTNISSVSEVVIVNATLSVDMLDHVLCSYDFYMSADGGLNWEAVDPNVVHIFTNTGDDLRWKVELSGLRDRSIHIFSVEIDYSYEPIEKTSMQFIPIGLAVLLISVFVTSLKGLKKKKQSKE